MISMKLAFYCSFALNIRKCLDSLNHMIGPIKNRHDPDYTTCNFHVIYLYLIYIINYAGIVTIEGLFKYIYNKTPFDPVLA